MRSVTVGMEFRIALTHYAKSVKVLASYTLVRVM